MAEEQGRFSLGPDTTDTVLAQVCDTAGQERFRAIATTYYRGANGAMLVYDVTDKLSFEALISWLKELQAIAPPDVVLMLLGNKGDMVRNPDTSVPVEDGLAFATEHNMAFMEVSALSGAGVAEAFGALLKQCDSLRKLKSDPGPSPGSAQPPPRQESVSVPTVKTPTEAKPGCC